MRRLEAPTQAPQVKFVPVTKSQLPFFDIAKIKVKKETQKEDKSLWNKKIMF